MEKLTDKDLQLIQEARNIIIKNYDDKDFNHTVGAAVRCKNGKVYVGVNVYSVHGACAEIIAIGAAITAGEREFDCIVAIRGKNQEVLPPCGNCRQILSDYMPQCNVIVKTKDQVGKVRVKELLPFAYEAKN